MSELNEQLERLANEMEDEAQPYDGDLKDSITAWVETLRDLAAPAPQAAPSEPVATRLAVWCGEMPESNGKTNYTAVLHRAESEGLDRFTEGMTITRSEYPDRVRYEADCVRHLIGELAEKPDILEYDADKHSGYVAPAPASPQQAQADARDAAPRITPWRERQRDGTAQSDQRAMEDEIAELRAAIAAATTSTEGRDHG